MSDCFGMGVQNPDLNQWKQYFDLEFNTMYEDERDFEKFMRENELRAKNFTKSYPRPYNKREAGLRKEHPDFPIWAVRLWFYITSFNADEEKAVIEIENKIIKKVKDSKNKENKKKLLKRLQNKRRR